MKWGAFRGATAWEAYVWRFWVRINFPQYWRFGTVVQVGFDRSDVHD
jgi:hypothetical protein